MKLSPLERRLLSIALLGFFVLLGVILEVSGERKIVRVSESEVEPEKKESSVKTVDFPIDVNTATYDELLSLPGIGPVKAKAIIRYREQNGPFESFEDLLEVPGIGRKTLEGIEDFINIEGKKSEGEKKSGKINVNTASLEELVKLPGIGEVKASRIIQNRPYEKPEDLLKVPGIGDKTLEKIKDLITF